MADHKMNAGRTIVLANLVAGSVLVILGIAVYFWIIPQYVSGADDDQGTIGPGFMPRLSVVSMVILGGGVAVNAILHLIRGDLDGDSHEDSEENEYLIFGRNEVVNTSILCAIAVIYTLLFEWTGFVVSAAVLLFLLIRATGYRNHAVTLGISFLLPLGLQQLLWRVLQIPLPDFPRIPF